MKAKSSPTLPVLTPEEREAEVYQAVARFLFPRLQRKAAEQQRQKAAKE